MWRRRPQRCGTGAQTSSDPPKLSYGGQSQRGGICQSRLLTVTTSLKQQGRDVLEFLVEAWNAHHHGLQAPSLMPPAK
jgi:transposase